MVSEFIREKQGVFLDIKSRFDKCVAQGTSSMPIAYLRRSGTCSEKLEELLTSVPTLSLDDDAYWNVVAAEDCAAPDGQWEQLFVSTSGRAHHGDDQLAFNNWKTIAEIAGQQLTRYLFQVGECYFPTSPIILWIQTMVAFHDRGQLSFGMRTKHVDEAAWIEFCRQSGTGEETAELESYVEARGMRTVCEDVVTASVLMSTWLATHDWPFEAELDTKVDEKSTDEQRSESNAHPRMEQGSTIPAIEDDAESLTAQQELGRKLWEYASANHSVGTDLYRLANLLKNGECAYDEAGEVLLPIDQSKTNRTKKFHAIAARLNRLVKKKRLNFHVIRDPDNKNQVTVKSGYKKKKGREKAKR